MPSMVAQTMLRQLISVVNTSIWKVALPYEAPQAFDGVGAANRPMHRLWKVIKGERVVFFLTQTAHRFRIACAILAFEGGQLDEGSLLGGLGPDAQQFGLNLMAHPPGNGMQHVALLVQEAALARRGRKQLLYCRQQSIMAVGHDEVHLRCPALAHVLQQAQPAVFALLSTRTPRQHFFVSSQVHT